MKSVMSMIWLRWIVVWIKENLGKPRRKWQKISGKGSRCCRKWVTKQGKAWVNTSRVVRKRLKQFISRALLCTIIWSRSRMSIVGCCAKSSRLMSRVNSISSRRIWWILGSSMRVSMIFKTMMKKMTRRIIVKRIRRRIRNNISDMVMMTRRRKMKKKIMKMLWNWRKRTWVERNSRRNKRDRSSRIDFSRI